MNGKSHTVVSGLGAMFFENIAHTVMLGHLPSALEQIVRAVGTPYSWKEMVVAVQHPALLVSLLFSIETAYKLAFYLLTMAWARVPDLDHRRGPLGEASSLLGGHRGCLHSCLAIFLLCAFLVGVSILLRTVLIIHHISVPTPLTRLAVIAATALVLSWLFHLLADVLTKGGIPLWWPERTRYGFPPDETWRFLSGSVVEYIIVCCLLLFVGISIGFGWLGI